MDMIFFLKRLSRSPELFSVHYCNCSVNVWSPRTLSFNYIWYATLVSNTCREISPHTERNCFHLIKLVWFQFHIIFTCSAYSITSSLLLLSYTKVWNLKSFSALLTWGGKRKLSWSLKRILTIFLPSINTVEVFVSTFRSITLPFCSL